MYYIEYRYCWKGCTTGRLGAYADVMAALRGYREMIADKGHLLFARVVDANGHIIRPIV